MSLNNVTALADVTSLLKTNYVGPVESALNENHEILGLLKDDDRKYVGQYAQFPVRTQYNPAARAMADDGYLPLAGQTTESTAQISVTTVAGRIRLTERTMEAAVADKGAFVDDLDYSMTNLEQALKNDVDRQCIGRSITLATPLTGFTEYTTGAIARVTANGTSSTTVTVDSTQQFNVGDRVLIGTAAASSSPLLGTVGLGTADSVTVSAIASATTLTVSSAITTAVDDIIAKGDTGASANAFTYELNGLEFIINDVSGTFENISTGTGWKSQVDDNSGTPRSLSIELMQTVLDEIENTSGRTPTHLVMHNTHRRQYLELLYPQVRFEARKPKGGFEGSEEVLSYNGGKKPLPIITSRYAMLGKIYFLDSMSVKKNWLKKWGWMNKDGSALSRVPNQAAYEATMTAQFQLGARNRVTSGLLADLST